MTNDLLTVSQAAALKGVSKTAIYDAIERGALAHERVLGRLGVRQSALAAWTPIGHKAGRPQGKPMSAESKKRLSESQKRRWQERKSR